MLKPFWLLVDNETYFFETLELAKEWAFDAGINKYMIIKQDFESKKSKIMVKVSSN